LDELRVKNSQFSTTVVQHQQQIEILKQQINQSKDLEKRLNQTISNIQVNQFLESKMNEKERNKQNTQT